MSARLVGLIAAGYDAWNQGDRTWVRDHMTPDATWYPPAGDPEAKPYEGVDAIEGFWDQWREAVGQLHFEPLEILTASDKVVAVTRRSGRGKQSGLEVSDTVVQVFSFNAEERCYSVREFYEREAALLDAGINEGLESADDRL